MSQFNDIREAIATLAGTSQYINEAFAYPQSNISKYPAVIVTTSENEADWGSTKTDSYTFVFKLMLLYPIPQGGDEAVAERALGNAVSDLIFNIFKERNCLGNVCDWVEPLPSAWGYYDNNNGVLRAATITMRCRKYI